MTKRTGENNLTDRIRKEAVFVLFSVLLILSLWLFISETVMSQDEGNITVDEEYFQELEEKYVREIRIYLEEQGFKNSGVSLTRVVEADGSRSYEVTMHHKDIQELSMEEQTELAENVKKMAFAIAGCNFQINILV